MTEYAHETDVLAALYGPSDSATPEKADRFPTDAEEAWIAKRVGVELYWNVGLSTPQTRRERIRKRIVDGDLADTRAGHRNGTPETFAELFERLYGQPLGPKP